MRFLVDTNVLSELVRPTPDARVLAWAGSVDQVGLSVITLDEIYYGLASNPRMQVQARLERYIEACCSLLDVTVVIAKHAGILRGQPGRRGRVRGQADMLIAATASAHGLTLATRNTRDFAGCGITLHDPFD